MSENKIKMLEFRVLQLELALGSLMQVVAFPDEHKDFKGKMEEALQIADGNNKEFIEMMLEDGAEA
tara:strand:+ start:197 stop:394 length:198 start_codon:yes stop_codon:yes gene_type:complete